MKRPLETILTLSLAFVVVYLITSGVHDWMLYAAIGIGVPGLFVRVFREAVDTAWFWITEKIGFVVSRVLLTVAFFLIVLPFGLLSRLFRKDLMHMKGGKDSYYIDRDHVFRADDLKNPW